MAFYDTILRRMCARTGAGWDAFLSRRVSAPTQAGKPWHDPRLGKLRGVQPAEA